MIGRIGTGGHCGGRCLHLGMKEGDRYLDPTLLIGWSAPTLRCG